jgi:SAM-dependent methyltransferase
MNFSPESSLMSFLRRIGKEPMAWALRRFHTPVDSKALVLEVGAGGNPYPRANVLLDAYESTRERHWAPLTSDRPTVLGFVENLPFKDHAFDFVIAAHVLEHSADPERFLAELQRVSKAGYIEVPDAFMERVNPYMDHRLEITFRNQKLIIRKKTAWQHDPEVIELYEDRVKPILTSVHLQIIQSCRMALGQVHDVYVVTNAGAVWRVVITAKNIQARKLACRHTAQKGHQVVRHSIGGFTNQTALVCTYGIEVAQTSNAPFHV